MNPSIFSGLLPQQALAMMAAQNAQNQGGGGGIPNAPGFGPPTTAPRSAAMPPMATPGVGPQPPGAGAGMFGQLMQNPQLMMQLAKMFGQGGGNSGLGTALAAGTPIPGTGGNALP